MCFDLNLVDYLSNIFEDSNLSLAIGFIIIHQNKAILQWLWIYEAIPVTI